MTKVHRTLMTFALAAACLGGAGAGCGSTYRYNSIGKAPAKPESCTFVLLFQPPTKPYDELGVLAPKDIEFDMLAGGGTPFTEAVHDAVCAAGGDAVVVEKNWAGNYVRGTVLRYK